MLTKARQSAVSCYGILWMLLCPTLRKSLSHMAEGPWQPCWRGPGGSGWQPWGWPATIWPALPTGLLSLLGARPQTETSHEHFCLKTMVHGSSFSTIMEQGADLLIILSIWSTIKTAEHNFCHNTSLPQQMTPFPSLWQDHSLSHLDTDKDVVLHHLIIIIMGWSGLLISILLLCIWQDHNLSPWHW